MEIDTKSIENQLNSFGQEVVNRARENLRAAGKGGGNLDRSIKFKVLPYEKGFTVQFSMANYGEFVDKGKEKIVHISLEAVKVQEVYIKA